MFQANRGSALEELIVMSSQAYRTRKIGLIQKVPTPWLPIRDAKGKIVSAKVERDEAVKAVDFLGHVCLTGQVIPLVFDAKETAADRWSLSRLEPHQYEYLADSYATRAFAFILIGFMTRGRFFVLPFPALKERWNTWKSHSRPASITITDPALIEIWFPQYLSGERLIQEINIPSSLQRRSG